jgi:hypothetical protein
MRPGQNKRMRGRPSNNRRGPNPLTRSYESNGPDVKIRGNAHHVAEKYLQLARDAHTGGDPVAAENYLQHAEHYFRLIAAAQAAQALAQSGQPRQSDAETDDFDEDDDFGGLSDRFASPSERAAYSQQQGFQPPVPATPNAPQPYVDRQPFEPERQNQGDRNGNGGFQPRHDRQGNRFQDRPPRPPQSGDRNENFRDRQNRDGRVREFRPYRDPVTSNGAPEAPPSNALPSFITAAPRSNVAEAEASPRSADTPLPGTVDSVGTSEPVPENASDTRFPGRGRRRRLRSPYGFNASQGEGEVEPPDSGGVASDETPIGE